MEDVEETNIQSEDEGDGVFHARNFNIVCTSSSATRSLSPGHIPQWLSADGIKVSQRREEDLLAPVKVCT